MKEDQDAEVGRLQKQVVTAKKKTIEEFRFSNDFQEAVELTLGE